jgi:hypothetical protein
MPNGKTIELEAPEALLLTVALREYLAGNRGCNESLLRGHATSRSVLEALVRRIDQATTSSAAPI